MREFFAKIGTGSIGMAVIEAVHRGYLDFLMLPDGSINIDLLDTILRNVIQAIVAIATVYSLVKKKKKQTNDLEG